MALRITRASDPILVDRLNMVLYGPPGTGKSSLGFTADKPLLLDFDRGAHRAAGRKDSVPISTWDDVAGITAADLAPFSTVILDTAGRALDVLSADIIRGNPKLGRGGALTLQGYGELKARFIAFLKLLNGFGKDVVLIAHMDEQRNGDEIIERLDVQGGSKGEIYKAADAMGRLTIKDGKRVLNFSPTDAAFGKNPAQLEPLLVPHFQAAEFGNFLGSVIQSTKDKLNELTEEQTKAQAKLEAWRLAVNDLEDADGINASLSKAVEIGQAAKSLLHDRATKLGLVFDAKAKQYAAAKAA
jgi:hypothetical protein